MYLVILMDTLNFGIVFPLLPSIAESFGASAAQVASLASGYSICQVLFTPLLGRASDRYGRRPVLLLAVFGTTLSAGLTGYSWTFPVLFAARCINGAAGATAGIANAYIADITTGEDRAVYISQLSAASSIGIIIGPAIGGVLSHLGFSVACYVSAALSGLNFLLGLAFLTESRIPQREITRALHAECNASGRDVEAHPVGSAPGRPASHALPRQAWILFAAGFVFMMGFAAFESVTGYYLMDTFFPGDPIKSGQFYGALFVTAGFAMLFNAVFLYRPLLRCLGEGRLILFGASLRTAGFVLMARASSPLLFAASTMVQVTGSNLIIPTTSSKLTTLCSKEIYGRALGYQQAVQAIARVFAPIMFGNIYDQWSHTASFYIVALTGVLGALLTLSVAKPAAGAAPSLEDVASNIEQLQRQVSLPPTLDGTPIHGKLSRSISEMSNGDAEERISPCHRLAGA